MTSSWEHPTSAWPLGAWIMVGILSIVTGLAVSARVLSPGLLLDGIALWPGLVPALAALVVVTVKKGWRHRTGAIPPLLIVTWIGLAGAAHLGGLAVLPSSSGELIGPDASPGLATMTIAADGRLLVGPTSGNQVYDVRYIRLGGPVGVPNAVETTTENSLHIAVSDGGSAPWFQYAGWRLGLDQSTEWNLSLTGDVAGDLSQLSVGSLTLGGRGTLTLGAVSKPTPVSVMGDYVVDLPSGVAATASGDAEVPPSWTEDSSPTPGAGWVFSVADGASLRINQP